MADVHRHHLPEPVVPYGLILLVLAHAAPVHLGQHMIVSTGETGVGVGVEGLQTFLSHVRRHQMEGSRLPGQQRNLYQISRLNSSRTIIISVARC